MLPGWSKETETAISTLRFGRDGESEVLSGLALLCVASALSPLGSGVKRRYNPCALHGSSAIIQRVSLGLERAQQEQTGTQ